MKIDGFTAEQIISIALLQVANVDYIEALNYDNIDWLEWFKVHRN